MKTRHRQYGLTLIELLVVMVLIGIIVSFSVLSLDFAGPEEHLKDESQRLQRLMALAKEEAILQGRQLAVLIEKDGYRFQILQGKQWLDINDDRILKPHELTGGIELKLEMEDVEFKLAGDEGSNKEDPKPRIFIMSSGEATPFKMEMKATDYEKLYRLEGDSLGRVTLEGPIEVF